MIYYWRFNNRTFNKKEAFRYLENENKRISFFFMIVSIILFLLNHFLYPQIVSIFLDLNQSIPELSKQINYILRISSILILLTGVYIYFIKVKKEEIRNKLEKFKNQTSIKSIELTNNKELYILISSLIIVALIVLGYISPIYSITKSF